MSVKDIKEAVEYILDGLHLEHYKELLLTQFNEDEPVCIRYTPKDIGEYAMFIASLSLMEFYSMAGVHVAICIDDEMNYEDMCGLLNGLIRTSPLGDAITRLEEGKFIASNGSELHIFNLEGKAGRQVYTHPLPTRNMLPHYHRVRVLLKDAVIGPNILSYFYNVYGRLADYGPNIKQRVIINK